MRKVLCPEKTSGLAEVNVIGMAALIQSGCFTYPVIVRASTPAGKVANSTAFTIMLLSLKSSFTEKSIYADKSAIVLKKGQESRPFVF